MHIKKSTEDVLFAYSINLVGQRFWMCSIEFKLGIKITYIYIDLNFSLILIMVHSHRLIFTDLFFLRSFIERDQRRYSHLWPVSVANQNIGHPLLLTTRQRYALLHAVAVAVLPLVPQVERLLLHVLGSNGFHSAQYFTLPEHCQSHLVTFDRHFTHLDLYHCRERGVQC